MSHLLIYSLHSIHCRCFQNHCFFFNFKQFLMSQTEPWYIYMCVCINWLMANDRKQHCHQQMHHRTTYFCLTWFLASVCYFCQTQSNWVLIFEAKPLWSFHLWCKPDLTSKLSKARSQWPNLKCHGTPYQQPVLFPCVSPTHVGYSFFVKFIIDTEYSVYIKCSLTATLRRFCYGAV